MLNYAKQKYPLLTTNQQPIRAKTGHQVFREDTLPRKGISIIIPALNEEKTIVRVIEEIPREQLENMGYKVSIVVVDNNSTDRTKQLAEGKGVIVISETRKGKGRAITTAFESASEDFIFMLDADYTYPATYIPQMLRLLELDYDVVLGSRLKGKIEKGAMGKRNLLGNHLLTMLANLLYRTNISDLCTGYWGFRGAIVRDIKLDANGFDLEANLLAHIAQKHCRIGEVPVYYRRRLTPSKLVGFRDGYIIVKTLIKMRFH
jgi:glycosyltransferase involved in cell wall biosynthesis